jgi:glycosyltransferase involved in cell wall biosynthesis
VQSVPDISVVVAAHNEERTITRCLASLFASRTALAVEVIVVDNGSTDRTVELAAGFAGVRLVSCDLRGAVHAKSAGVAVARAPLVAVLDADSFCPPDWLDQIARSFAAEARLVGLSGPARYLRPRWWVHVIMALWYGFWKLIQLVFGTAFYATGTNVAFRREAYRAAGGFDTNVLVGGDEVGFFHRMRKVGLTRFTDELVVDTDARRTEVGFWRFFLCTVLLYYVFNYTFYRITGISFLKRYPPGSQLSKDQPNLTSR